MQKKHSQKKHSKFQLESIGKRVRETRSRLGLSQAALAKKIGVTSSAISQWESGQIKSLRVANLVALAEALGVDLQWLLYGEEASLDSVAPEAIQVAKRVQKLAPRHREMVAEMIEALTKLEEAA